MKTSRTIGVVALLALIGCFLWSKWKYAEPRRTSAQALQNLCRALNSNNPGSLLDAVVLPQALAGRTAAEEDEFLVKALRDEISPEGIAVLHKDGAFGPLTNLFPAEAMAWTTAAGVKPENCVAFKLERHGLRAEVVLVREAETFRVLRCNNVKQLAAARL